MFCLPYLQVVADYNGAEKSFKPDPDRKIHWGGPTPYVIPLDFPRCGYDNSRCPPSGNHLSLITRYILRGLVLTNTYLALYKAITFNKRTECEPSQFGSTREHNAAANAVNAQCSAMYQQQIMLSGQPVRAQLWLFGLPEIPCQL